MKLNAKHRIAVTAMVVVMVFSAVSILAASRGASAQAGTGPLIFKNGQVTVFINTDNVLRIGIVDEFVNVFSAYDTLVSIDADLARVNWLAYDYQEPLELGVANTYRFYLVRDACWLDPALTNDAVAQQTFCNGHPVTASDVAFTYNMLKWLRTTRNPSPSLDAYVERLDRAIVVDTYTVDIRFTQTYAPWYSTFFAVPILPEFQWGPVNATQDIVAWDPPKIIGSGPLLSIRADTQVLELHKHDIGRAGHWWGTNAYNLEIRPDRIQYIAYGTQENAKLALLRGEIDIDLDPGASNYVGSLVGATVGGLPVQRYALSTLGFIYEAPSMNVADAAVRDTSPRYRQGHSNPALFRQEVRTAIQMSVSGPQLDEKALLGLGSPGETFIPSNHAWHYDVPSAEERQFDLIGARTLLNNAGWIYDGAFALANNGQLRVAPTATPLAADLDGSGSINTAFYGGEILKFRFATFNNPPEWERMYRLMQGWAATTGVRLMDGSGGECGTEAGCGLINPTEMNSLWTSLDYDTWIWDWVLGTVSDPSSLLWLETTMATEAIYADNGYTNPYYDAQYNRTLEILDTNCRRLGGAACPANLRFVTFTGTGSSLYIDDRGTATPTMQPYQRGVQYNREYLGTDGMQRMIYDFASYVIPLELAVPYAFHELRWSGFGDWNVHKALAPDTSIYWLYFQISPVVQKAPVVSQLPAFQALSGGQVTLSALATDSDGPSALSYVWDTNEGIDTGGDNIPNNDRDVVTTSATATIAAPTLGAADPNIVTFGVNVRVSDGKWTQKARSSLTIIKNPELQRAPDVRGISFTPGDPWISLTYTDPVTFFASAASRSGNALSYRWSFGDGQSSTVGALVPHTYAATGTYTATVFVTDTGNNQRGQFSTLLTVGTNAVPFASELPTLQAIETRAVDFVALASDLNSRDNLRFDWTFGPSGAIGEGQTTSYTYVLGTSTGSPYVYSLTVTDTLGQNVRKEGRVYVIPDVPNQAPAAATIRCFVGATPCGNNNVFEHQTIRIEFDASDPEGNPLSASYQLSPSNILDGGSLPPAGRNEVVTFRQDIVVPVGGLNWNLGATVRDAPAADKTPGSDSLTTTIRRNANSVPVLLSPGLVGTTVSFGTRVTYTVTPSDSNDATLTYTIAFGDDTSQSGTAVSGAPLSLPHDYGIAGTMNVVFTIRDPKGASSTYMATSIIRGTLGSFPFPFADRGVIHSNLVLGLSQLHLGLGAASTIDVVGGVPLGGAIGRVTTSGSLGALLDTEAVSADGSRVVAAGNLMGLGGRGNNAYTRLINPNLPVRQAIAGQDGTGAGIWCSPNNYIITTNADGSRDHYALFAIYYDALQDRYNIAAVGLSGFATRAMSELISRNVMGLLPAPNTAGSVLTGTGIVVKLHDNAPVDNVFETYQVVCGTGGAANMGAAVPIPARPTTARLFAIGLSQVHGVAAAASTIDVVGGVTLAAKMGRDLRASGAVWGALDTEVVSLDGTTLLNTADNLVSLGGRGNNLVSRYYNPQLAVRQALSTDGTGLGIYSTASGLNYQNANVLNPDGSLNYRQQYALNSYINDAPNGNRLVEVVAGLSGFGTRASSVALADGTVSRGANHGIVISLQDLGGDNTFESIGVADSAP